MNITTDDLYKNLYNYEMLKEHVYVVSLLDIVKSQKLSAEFCVKYILNENFQFTKEEQSITIDTVLTYQPHITLLDLIATRNRSNSIAELFE